ncbi:MAG: topoisomerase IV, partial [Clostridiales bacterium]
MPYAMSVIVSRAIPEIDGFKPAHRKLLYTMYKMGLMTGAKTKSAKVVGQTMMLNPHGDGAIYETLVRLTTGKEALLHPFVESKGSFGKQYSDMAYAASRYTEVKLAPFCAEIFDGIDRDAVDMVDNYDGTMKEPAILPVSFPNVLVSPNTGIAVGMASTICSFNLGEICDVTTAFIQNESITCDEMLDILKAPDFSTGGLLLYDREKLKEIYTTGRGSFKVRAKYTYDKAANRIEVTQIPYTTTLEKIKSVIVSLVKNGRIKEIADVRDETDLNGLKLTIDLKRGSDSEKLMARLFKITPLEDDFACNFNILVGGTPMTLGIREILDEWAAFRVECLRRTFIYDLEKKSDKLHLLYGLKEILLDIDLAISIIRNTETEKEVVPNLMAGFGIDEKQAEYVADIKLRNINREYIVNRISEIDELEKETAELRELIADDRKIKKVIVRQLKAIKAKYAIPRKTFILYEDDVVADVQEETVEDYPVVAFLSREGYFKKCTLASL